MKTKYLTTLNWILFILPSGFLFAQSGCPGCEVTLPELIPEDTLFLSPAPNGQTGVYYEEDISFRMPLTTDPVAEADPTVPPGITINAVTINTLTNVPPGLGWELSGFEFDLPDQKDGCIRFCGTPLQPGLYMVEVVLTAEVFVISSTTSFAFPILIEPSVSQTEGFNLVNNSGCGAVEVVFENNVPSNGMEGFSYAWDFGDGGSSIDETPQNRIYDEPGVFPISYQAVVDTFGYVLTDITIESTTCNDFLGGAPDIYLKVFDPEGEELFISTEVGNATFPLSVNMNLPVEEGNYSIVVYDNDAVLGGADDVCGTINFNQQSLGNLSDEGLEIALTIFHPIDTIRSTDSVWVFFQPSAPVIEGIPTDMLCDGDEVVLENAYDQNIQWYRDSVPIIEGLESSLEVLETGEYWVAYTSEEGCSAISEPVELLFNPLPEFPAYSAENNLLSLFNEEVLPANYSLQWYMDDELLPGETGLNYCVAETAAYTLEIVDEDTGCSSTYTQMVEYNPDFTACLSSAEEWDIRLGSIVFSPNPVKDQLTMNLEVKELSNLQIIIFDAWGRLVLEQENYDVLGDKYYHFDFSTRPAGLYNIQLHVNDIQKGFKILKI